MALTTQSQVTASALAVAGFANQLKAAKVVAEEYSLFNSVTDPGWSGLTHANNPTLVDVNGLIIGTNITPAQISSAIGSLNVFLNFYTGANPITQSAWGNNLEAIANPTV